MKALTWILIAATLSFEPSGLKEQFFPVPPQAPIDYDAYDTDDLIGLANRLARWRRHAEAIDDLQPDRPER